MPLQMPIWDQQELETGLRDFITLRDPRAIVLLTAAVDARFKLPVYTLGLLDVVGANGLRAASPAGWRYMAAAHGQAAAAEITQSNGRITSLASGPHIQKAVDALIALHRHEEVRGQNYRVVILRVPGARVEAYWLQVGEVISDADRVWLYLAVNKRLSTGMLLPAEVFLDAIRDKDFAQRHLEFYRHDLAGV